ncbi:cache domain-containing protein [Leucobacter sp. GX24907]
MYSPSRELRTIADALQEHIRMMTDELVLLTERVTALIKDVHHRSDGVTRADLARLSSHLQGVLRDSESTMDGIGIATAAGYLEDCEYWLEWWRKGSRGEVEFVVHSLNPEQDVFYDYASRIWFAKPMAEGRAIVTGPYVDMGGTNSYTVTVAIPIEIMGRAIGVAGADVVASRFERYLLAPAQESGSRALFLLANSDGRVIASGSSEHPPGTLLAPSVEEGWSSLPVDHGAPPQDHWRLFELP